MNTQDLFRMIQMPQEAVEWAEDFPDFTQAWFACPLRKWLEIWHKRTVGVAYEQFRDANENLLEQEHATAFDAYDRERNEIWEKHYGARGEVWAEWRCKYDAAFHVPEEKVKAAIVRVWQGIWPKIPAGCKHWTEVESEMEQAYRRFLEVEKAVKIGVLVRSAAEFRMLYTCPSAVLDLKKSFESAIYG